VLGVAQGLRAADVRAQVVAFDQVARGREGAEELVGRDGVLDMDAVRPVAGDDVARGRGRAADRRVAGPDYLDAIDGIAARNRAGNVRADVVARDERARSVIDEDPAKT